MDNFKVRAMICQAHFDKCVDLQTLYSQLIQNKTIQQILMVNHPTDPEIIVNTTSDISLTFQTCRVTVAGIKSKSECLIALRRLKIFNIKRISTVKVVCSFKASYEDAIKLYGSRGPNRPVVFDIPDEVHTDVVNFRVSPGDRGLCEARNLVNAKIAYQQMQDRLLELRSSQVMVDVNPN